MRFNRFDQSENDIYQQVVQDPQSSMIPLYNYLDVRHTNNTFVLSKIRYFGNYQIISAEDRDNFELSQESTRRYQKIVYKGCLFESTRKIKRRTENAYAFTEDGIFVQILDFLIDTESREEWTKCRELYVEPFDNNMLGILKVTGCSDKAILARTSCLESICVNIKVGDDCYIARVPNLHHYS